MRGALCGFESFCKVIVTGARSAICVHVAEMERRGSATEAGITKLGVRQGGICTTQRVTLIAQLGLSCCIQIPVAYGDVGYS